jgi:hypothetical protein
MEDTTVDDVTEANVADDDMDAEVLMARKPKGDGYVEQDN